uniref:Reverse transcriptase domain-containing protein n=1 Tax=Astyanax mexicanus TaxID=7994 RepID=A0A8B9L5B5_ASTMX
NLSSLAAEEMYNLTLLRAPGCDSNLSNNFTTQELELVIQCLKTGKAPGIDESNDWLCSFLSACLRYLKLPKIWRCAKVIALPKPNKPSDDPKGYRPISLLCVPYKLLERLILARLTPLHPSLYITNCKQTTGFFW